MKVFSSAYTLIPLIILGALVAGCKKTVEKPAEDLARVLFEQNILNKDFIVQLAVDNTDTITDQFTGYKFKLLKSSYEDGPLTATKDGTVYNGTWSCTENYGKLTITLSTSPITQFGFLSRPWRFTSKDLPIMKLAPWGVANPSPTELNMERVQ